MTSLRELVRGRRSFPLPANVPQPLRKAAEEYERLVGRERHAAVLASAAPAKQRHAAMQQALDQTEAIVADLDRWLDTTEALVEDNRDEWTASVAAEIAETRARYAAAVETLIAEREKLAELETLEAWLAAFPDNARYTPKPRRLNGLLGRNHEPVAWPELADALRNDAGDRIPARMPTTIWGRAAEGGRTLVGTRG